MCFLGTARAPAHQMLATANRESGHGYRPSSTHEGAEAPSGCRGGSWPPCHAASNPECVPVPQGPARVSCCPCPGAFTTCSLTGLPACHQDGPSSSTQIHLGPSPPMARGQASQAPAPECPLEISMESWGGGPPDPKKLNPTNIHEMYCAWSRELGLGGGTEGGLAHWL